MNLKPLFEAQRKLRQHIHETHPELIGRNLLPELILAFNVELGECANEWRGFKFWSKDREPRTKVFVGFDDSDESAKPPMYKNPLLEEYVDALHFLLEIGIEMGINTENYTDVPTNFKDSTIVSQFNGVMNFALDGEDAGNPPVWYACFTSLFCSLGEMLGFTWAQIEQAYFTKNAENHARQERGY